MNPEDVASQYISMRVPPAMREVIRKMAREERRPISLMTRLLLEEAIEGRRKRALRNGRKTA